MIINSNSQLIISKTGILARLHEDNTLCTMPFSQILNINVDTNGSIVLCFKDTFRRLYTNNKKDFENLCQAFMDFKTQELVEKMILTNPLESVEVIQLKARQIIFSYYKV
jgi:hypothetical protein